MRRKSKSGDLLTSINEQLITRPTLTKRRVSAKTTSVLVERMSASTALSLQVATQQTNIYFGLFIFITGVIGNALNIAVFTSLKIFRETTCAFYLTATSVVNILDLIVTVLLNILNSGFNIHTADETWFCKVRFFLAQWFSLLSMTTTCLAIVDQLLAMTYPHLISLKSAHRYVLVASLVWLLHGIPSLLYWESVSGRCLIVNRHFTNYYAYFFIPVLVGTLPIVIMIVCALWAFHQARTLASRQVYIVRLSRDRQLTAMVLVQVIFVVVVSLPFLVTYSYSLSVSSTDPIYNARMTLARGITFLFYSQIYAVRS